MYLQCNGCLYEPQYKRTIDVYIYGLYTRVRNLIFCGRQIRKSGLKTRQSIRTTFIYGYAYYYCYIRNVKNFSDITVHGRYTVELPFVIFCFFPRRSYNNSDDKACTYILIYTYLRREYNGKSFSRITTGCRKFLR